MIDIGAFMASYLVYGYFRFNATAILEKLCLQAFEPIKNKDATFLTEDPEERYRAYTPAQRVRLKRLATDLSENYFLHFNHELRFSDMWATSNPNTYDWHCDTLRCWKGFNSSVNCYFDDTDPTTGGELQVKAVDSSEVVGIYPMYGDVIVLNQHPSFQHRVTHSDVPRKMVAYAGAFFDINPI